MSRKPNETVQLKLRFSDGLRRQLERAASSNDRSMNSEIIKRLERSFRSEQRNLIFSIFNATNGHDAPKWDSQLEHPLKFAPETKAAMTEKITAFIASLPEAPPAPKLTKEEADDLWEMIQRHQKLDGAKIKSKR